MSEPILQCTGLCKNYGQKTALDNVTFSLQRGRIIGLLGPNGSGKSTLMKLANGLLTPSSGEIRIAGNVPGIETHAIVSYLPERTYFSDWMTADDLLNFFQDFYSDFNINKAADMLTHLGIQPRDTLKTMSKGTKEKVQLILVMSRDAKLYVLDEPIGGVDPAARDYILRTILTNYNPNASVLIATHLISDIENILDEVIFLQNGEVRMHTTVEEVRASEGKSVDALFREVFRC